MNTISTKNYIAKKAQAIEELSPLGHEIYNKLNRMSNNYKLFLASLSELFDNLQKVKTGEMDFVQYYDFLQRTFVAIGEANRVMYQSIFDMEQEIKNEKESYILSQLRQSIDNYVESNKMDKYHSYLSSIRRDYLKGDKESAFKTVENFINLLLKFCTAINELPENFLWLATSYQRN